MRTMSLHRATLTLAMLALVACHMDNPAFEGGDDEQGAGTAASESSDDADSSSGMSESASEVGESSSATSNVTSSSDGSTDDASGCVPGEACDDCSECNTLGVCVPTPGATCGEVDCANYIAGSDGVVCYAYPTQRVPKTCDEQGECIVPLFDECVGFGEPLCELACAASCDPDVHVSQIGCELDGQTDACSGTFCTDDWWMIGEMWCVEGVCLPFEEECPPNSGCDGGECMPMG
jgi:hypothetical protein